MRAEIEKDLESRLSGINSRLDKLPSTATFISTIIGGLAIALSLLFALLSWSSDRVDTAWQRSATMAQTLDKLVVQGDQNQKALEELRRKPTQEENKTTK